MSNETDIEEFRTNLGRYWLMLKIKRKVKDGVNKRFSECSQEELEFSGYSILIGSQRTLKIELSLDEAMDLAKILNENIDTIKRALRHELELKADKLKLN